MEIGGLFLLVARRRYSQIPAYIRDHPDDVLRRNSFGSTVLHKLCRFQHNIYGDEESFLGAVDAIIAEAPHLVGQTDRKSLTPLHLACDEWRRYWRSNPVRERLVLKLLDAFPEAVSVPLFAESATKPVFYLACENNAPLSVLRKMLSIDPSLATLPAFRQGQKRKKSLIDMCWGMLLPRPAAVASGPSADLEPPTILRTPLQCLEGDLFLRPPLQRRDIAMETMELVLMAACTGDVDGMDTKFNLLCAACSMQCLPEYISMVICDNPKSIYQKDRHGLLPLHHAVRNAEVEHFYSTCCVLEELLEKYPNAAGMPFVHEVVDGVLPLHMLISRGCTMSQDIVMCLAKAYPDALWTPDPRTGLVPALASAETADKNEHHLSTTYSLLRAGPDVISHFLKE